jgi:chromosomal replication initiator protein
VNLKLEHVSARLHTELRAAVDEATYRLWLEPLRVEGLTGDTLLLCAPAPIAPWIEQRFGDVLSRCARRTVGTTVQVTLASLEAGVGRAATRGSSSQQRSPKLLRTPVESHALDPIPHVRPNPQLTFDRFVIGECNRLAHGAALTIAEAPGQGFNPLFICGPPGVGKTHLLHSVSTFLRSHDPSTVVCLTTSESFTNEFLAALHENRVNSFKARFRRVDVLLVDDIQFLERKTRTEEEFFHTFNALYEVGSQIIMTSDRPPQDMRELEARLRERFEAGLVADIHPPDLTTRVAILRKRIRDQNVKLADDAVVDLIAARVTTSVRALEGALIRVVAFGSLTGRKLSVALATDVLDSLYGSVAMASKPAGAISIAQIQTAACKHFNLSHDALLSSSRAQHLAWPRQLAMYLAREITGESLPAIGRHFGGRDHTTVLYACRRARDRLNHDNDARNTLAALRAALAEELSVSHAP